MDKKQIGLFTLIAGAASIGFIFSSHINVRKGEKETGVKRGYIKLNNRHRNVESCVDQRIFDVLDE